MESRKMQLVASGLVLFLSGTLLGGYIVWSQQKAGSVWRNGEMMRTGTKSQPIFHATDSPAAEPGDSNQAKPPQMVPTSVPIGTKSAPVFMPEDIARSAPLDSPPSQPVPPSPPVEEPVDALYLPLQQSSANNAAP